MHRVDRAGRERRRRRDEERREGLPEADLLALHVALTRVEARAGEDRVVHDGLAEVRDDQEDGEEAAHDPEERPGLAFAQQHQAKRVDEGQSG